MPCGIDHVRMTSVSKETGRGRLAALLPQADGLAVRGGVRACGSGSCRARPAAASASGGAGMSTRSRSNPGGARVLELMGEVRPFRERKPAWFKRPAPGGPALPRAARDDRGRGPPHGLPGGGLPEHRRVLGARHRHLHDPRRHLHAPLRLLQRQDRQADPQRSARAAARGAVGEADGPAARGDHERGPRRPARPRRARLRRRDPLDPAHGARLQGRGAHARLPRRGDAARARDRRAAGRLQPQRRDRAAAVSAGPPRLALPALVPGAAERQGDGRRRGRDQVGADDRPRRVEGGAARDLRRRCASTACRC